MLQVSSAYASGARPRLLVWWLWIVAALVVAMVVVGGITRLTESGLSITRWKPISGIVPPLNAAQWEAEFAAYRQIPEYREMNAGMTLAGFKAIFFWEFLHRLLGRLIGMAFALPLLWFTIRRQVPRGYGRRLVALLALGGLQGAIGWWMVTSGLSVRTDVSHLRLAVHLITALLILAGITWTALDLRALARNPRARPAGMPALGWAALILLFVQLVWGAFTAGLDAGYAFSSWPLMGDRLFPEGGWQAGWGWLRNLVDNPIAVQFVHRWLAFAAAAGLITLAWRCRRVAGSGWGELLVVLVLLQIALGISTLLTGVAIGIAVAHQANAALLVIAAVGAAHACDRRV